MKMSVRRSLRTRGRPGNQPGILRAELMDVARRRLALGETNSLALSHVAKAAGVTPALAHYYFGDRDGLLDAITEEFARPLVDPLLAALRARTAQHRAALTQFMQIYTTLCARNPWLQPTLLQGSPAARKLLSQIHTLLADLIRRAQSAQQLREDLPPQYIAQALWSLCAFPFLPQWRVGTDAPALTDQVSATQLTLRHVALLQDGLVRHYSPRQESGA
jgi:TetR/AcrR family transcriptional regulator